MDHPPLCTDRWQTGGVIVVVCPGQGSQTPGFLSPWLELEGVADSGSGVEFANGMGQVSYDVLPGIANSRVGDPVRICLVSVPENCPPGDDRGRVYSGTNLRTNETWTAPDSQHMCGGA